MLGCNFLSIDKRKPEYCLLGVEGGFRVDLREFIHAERFVGGRQLL
eukprot:COSAG01_NODE_34984_length_539_cov_0.588636_1_plen_45_part_10